MLLGESGRQVAGHNHSWIYFPILKFSFGGQWDYLFYLLSYANKIDELILRNRGLNGLILVVFWQKSIILSWSETHCTLHQLTRYWHGE